METVRFVKRKVDDILKGVEVIGEAVSPASPKVREAKLIRRVAEGFMNPAIDPILEGPPLPTGFWDAVVNYPGFITIGLDIVLAAKDLKNMAGSKGLDFYNTRVQDEIAKIKGYGSYAELKDQNPELGQQIDGRFSKAIARGEKLDKSTSI